MIEMRYTTVIICFMFCFVGCKERKGLEKEVMEIHDEVMPRLGELNKDRKALQEILKVTDEVTTKQELLNAIADLEAAEEGMMVWMSEWSVPKSEPEKTIYLKGEMVRIQKVKDDMIYSMSTAKLLTTKHLK